ncbi:MULTISPECIES: phosphoribosyltransferase family protein [unclassified Streptomyces]|uniref:phosphoribosyltransferase family protein n=1 Tax=unclassified Streptomyces TaxID=2593676 RepID=UPI002E0EAFEB|nr:phosphoribosyltransferase family protein [Streptomyces sp. NBC_01207]WTA17139.1 phosphoribosyltransferase family protein [Streptomyces sp. NBC_00853]
MFFADRTAAGRQLAGEVSRLGLAEPVVLGLPRGGVPVAAEVARVLGAPLDVIVVRKLGVPFQPEVAFGAIGEGGVRLISGATVRAAGLGERDCARVEEAERAELQRRLTRYRHGRERIALTGRTVVIVDDGIATGSTASVACEVAREHGAAQVVLAVPVAAPQALEQLRRVADEVVCLSVPRLFYAVGQWYEDFSQVEDEEVAALLATAARARPAAPAQASGQDPAQTGEVAVDAGGTALPGLLTVPEGAVGVVVFAHGSGSSRLSPRNRHVAEVLNRAGLATLLFDLLTPSEARDRAKVFDIPLLALRLTQATSWLRSRVPLRICYFGASTGAAAALMAAAEPRSDITAIVSRGGRPDLAVSRLAAVRAPTLLIVGGADDQVLDLNRQAAARLRCEHQVGVVPGATHLFEEPGALDAVADAALDWFVRHLPHLGAVPRRSDEHRQP